MKITLTPKWAIAALAVIALLLVAPCCATTPQAVGAQLELASKDVADAALVVEADDPDLAEKLVQLAGILEGLGLAVEGAAGDGAGSPAVLAQAALEAAQKLLEGEDVPTEVKLAVVAAKSALRRLVPAE